MSLRKFTPRLDWLSENDSPLSAPKRIFCERIICVHDEYIERGWWHELEHADELLFADAGRIVESHLEDLADCIEKAVEAGFRPVLFIDGMRNWAPAMAALGRHQAFGSVYVCGKDDELMSSLLHSPSAEIMSIAEHGGRIIVPGLEYGAALEHYLDASLEDFYLTELDDNDPLAPKLKLVCRLNLYRYINATLYLRNGMVRLHQQYSTGEQGSGSDQSCDQPVRFQQWLLDFTASNPFNTSTITDDPLEFLKVFTETFEMPIAFRGWQTGHEPPWKVLLKRLDEMSHGVMDYLTPVHQALLALVDKDTIIDGLEELQPVFRGSGAFPNPIRGQELEGDEFEEPAGLGEEQRPFLVLIPASDEETSEESPQMVFDVKWLTPKKPDMAPLIFLEQDEAGKAQEQVTWSWSEDLQSLTLYGVSTVNMQLGWVWLAEKNTLSVSLRKGKDE